MNILFLVWTMPILPNAGGVQRVTSILAKEMIRRGHHVYYLAYRFRKSELCDSPPYYFVSCEEDEQEIRQKVQAIIDRHNIRYAINQQGYAMLKYIPSSVKKIDVCHIQPYYTDGMTRRRVWASNVKNYRQFIFKTASLISPKIYEWMFNRVADSYFRSTVNLADKLCLLSDKFFPRLLRHLPDFPQEKLCAINNPNSFDVEQIKVSQQRENLILWVGRVEVDQKNTVGFIQMWKLLSAHNSDWRAIVIGDGEDLEYCKNYAIRHKVERIEFTGSRRDVADFYARARFIGITSFWESWCMVLTEAMAYGCVPCVYDTYESLRDIVDDGVSGMIVKPTPEAMAERIQWSIDHPEEWRAMSEEAHKRVKRFSVDRIVDQWEDLLKSL